MTQEKQVQEALALLDVALVDYDKHVAYDKAVTGQMEVQMGQTIETRGCQNCGGTMYRTVDTDENGNPTNVSQYICGACGAMA